MRCAATVLLVFAVGIHCAAPVDGARGEGVEDEQSAGGEAEPERSDPAPALEAPPETPTDQHRSAFAPRPDFVTTTADGGGGVRYVAGVFSGTLSVGDTTLTSHGNDDVFLARIDSTGHVTWARAIGSASAESGPHVTFEEGRVKVVALTRGDVDCGTGPMNTWSSKMFFFCVFGGTEGTPLAGGSFPTGAP